MQGKSQINQEINYQLANLELKALEKLAFPHHNHSASDWS